MAFDVELARKIAMEAIIDQYQSRSLFIALHGRLEAGCDEIETLRDLLTSRSQKLIEAEAKLERYREVLTSIADTSCYCCMQCGSDPDASEKAEKALAEDEVKDGV